ncbi:hypothetical protein [Halobellus rubicundus]|uniref:Dna2/Cas4 domain-containing protein n=1 Tax=Halobellus rubicundus TaxID=2996466 RepID=A0ABD5ME47_9EURY
MSTRPETIPFSHLARAAYCPRQLYYARRDDDLSPPEDVAAVRDLAFAYDRLRGMRDERLADRPIAVPPAEYRANLATVAERDDYAALAEPAVRDAFLRGRDCHGIAHKVIGVDPEGAAEAGSGADGASDDVDAGDDGANSVADGDRNGVSPTPVVISPGAPPERGVWEPQRVRAVAAAKALAWERERDIPTALVEYPAHGVVRTVRLTTRNKSAYRRVLWTVRSMSGVPSRTHEKSKCEACEYRGACGTKTRSLKTMLGLG